MNTHRPPPIDVTGLEAALRRCLRGEVRFDDGSRALYATDAGNYRHIPYGVVLPRDIDDMVAAVECCRIFDAPIVNRGGGTGLTSGCANVAVVIDSSKYVNRILSIDSEKRRAVVEPGVILDSLRDKLTPHGLTFGPDPATHNRCTLGGMIGNNSCGMHAQMSGRVADNIEELEILTYRGLRLKVGPNSPAEIEEILRSGDGRAELYDKLIRLRDNYADDIRTRYPHIPRRISGYGLDELLPENDFNIARALVGSESTCITVLNATVRLVYNPSHRTLLALGYPDIFTAADHVPEVTSFGPIALEGMDRRLIEDVKHVGSGLAHSVDLLPAGKAFLIAEFGGDSREEANSKSDRLTAAMKKRGLSAESIKRFDDHDEEDQIWHVREAGLGATAFPKGKADTHEGWEDAAVAPERLGSYLRGFRSLLDNYKYDTAIYGHFGQGCIHCRINFDFGTKGGREKFRSFISDAADLVLANGGSLSGEHGDGQSRSALLPKMFGPRLIQAFRDFKEIWDPDFKMNPRRIVNPAQPDEDMRLGQQFRHVEPSTHFHYPEDGGSFQHATVRCVGVGLCRRERGGTMCPSYRVTHEEKHTTRGRAHLLYEMLQEGTVHGGWRDKNVKEALDLCLACKGCKGDCPVHVDVATLKAEFMAHYYQGRLRPRAAYAMGFINTWAKIASKAPTLANLLTQTPGLSTLSQVIGGITSERRMPPFAHETFRSWFIRRERHHTFGPRVFLWADTFNTYFHPEVAKAAVDILEYAGFEVLISAKPLCCGRPLYDFGFLKRAKARLRTVLEEMEDVLAQKIPIVGLEPSCLSVFRDELPSLLADDPRARELQARAFTLAEFLTNNAANLKFPMLKNAARVQRHCHCSVLGFHDDEAILDGIGLDVKVLDSGCCGLAGSFGFEASKFDVSKRIAEQGLIPALSDAPRDSFIIADGFSCRTQIEQLTDRVPLHLAQVLQRSIHHDRELPS